MSFIEKALRIIIGTILIVFLVKAGFNYLKSHASDKYHNDSCPEERRKRRLKR